MVGLYQRRAMRSMSPGAKPMSLSSRTVSCDRALRVTRASFQRMKAVTMAAAKFARIVRDADIAELRDESRYAIGDVLLENDVRGVCLYAGHLVALRGLGYWEKQHNRYAIFACLSMDIGYCY